MRRFCLAILGFFVLGFLMSGCGAYRVAVDQRTLGEQVDDEKMTMVIRKKFVEDDVVKTLDISTYCYNGHVYLLGEYDRPEQRTRAVTLAKGVEGVKSVKDHFLAKRKGDLCGTTDNLEFEARVKAKLVEDEDIRSPNIEIETVQCHIVLLGLVRSQKEISKAIAHAKSVRGVRSVTSYLKLVK